MAGSIAELSKYRYERALEDLKNAKEVFNSGSYKLALNRSYYAIFHAMRAVNVLDEFDSSKHSGVIAHFNQYHVKTGDFEKYYEQLEHMPEPIMASELPKVKLNLRGVREYARKKGVTVASLSDEEKYLFMES